MKAVQFGAGNIGRGFIGAVLSQAGYDVVFADVAEEILNLINSRREYTVHVTDTESYDIDIKGVSAVHSGSAELVEHIKDASLVTTAVGLRVLKFIAPAIAGGIRARRAAANESPLNIIACENGLKASSRLKELVFSQLDSADILWAESHIGFPDAAVDRIVPPVRCEMPLDVAVEEYFEWDVERGAFVGGVPQIKGMTPVDKLEAYVERKLFTLNTGHATAAYLGHIKGIETIGECVADARILSLVRETMQQSGEALVRKFGFDHDAHFAYIEKILRRFANPYLRDECRRVGREPLRKLSPDDRLVLPLMTAKAFGLPYDKLVLAIAAALRFDNPEDAQSVEMLSSIKAEGLEATISKYTGIAKGDPLVSEITDAYKGLDNI